MADSQAETEPMGEEEEQELVYHESFIQDIITIEHSFGYDCKKLFNLVLVDPDTLVFASGNFLKYFSISRQEITFQETTYGCGIGFITVCNPALTDLLSYYHFLACRKTSIPPTWACLRWRRTDQRPLCSSTSIPR